MTHGMSNTRLYKVWCGMVHRCHSQDAHAKRYWNRGIVVCDDWRNSFEAFYDWAMANGFSDGLTIDRIDVNGNYCPENCRWVDRRTQANNRTNNKLLTHNGKTQTVSQWADEIGIKYQTLICRLCQRHWSVERALTTPVRRLHKEI